MAAIHLGDIDRALSYGTDVFIQRRTVRVVDRTDVGNAGTGVTLKVGQRFFVMTAAHVIAKNHEFGIASTSPRLEPYSDFLARHTNSDRDVGLLELNPNSIIDFANSCEFQFLEFDRLYRGRYPRPSVPIHVVGFPGHNPMQTVTTVKVSSEGTEHWVGCRTLSYVTAALARGEWPRLSPPSRTINRGLDIFCSYDPDSENIIGQDLRTLPASVDKFSLSSLPLTGMSGGGLWIVGSKTSEADVTIPMAMLAGLQSSYPQGGQGKWLRGTRTAALLELIYTHYPDLIDESSASEVITIGRKRS